MTIFVLPEYHGKGIGRKIINTLEQDEFYARATRIEIPASITATEFTENLDMIIRMKLRSWMKNIITGWKNLRRCRFK